MSGTVGAGDRAVNKTGEIHCIQEFLTNQVNQITGKPSAYQPTIYQLQLETDAVN